MNVLKIGLTCYKENRLTSGIVPKNGCSVLFSLCSEITENIKYMYYNRFVVLAGF